MQARPRNMEVSMSDLPGAVIWTPNGSRETAGQSIRATVPADEVAKLSVLVAAPGSGPEQQDFTFSVRSADGEADRTDAVFERPKK